MTAAKSLRSQLREGGLLAAPGAYDAIGARLIEQAGFAAVYMTGAGTSVGARLSRLRPVDDGRDGRQRRTDGALRRRAADRRCRHRLRQRAQRDPHRARVRGARRRRDPHRGPGRAQALRPPRRQGGGLARGVRLQDPRRGRGPAHARVPHHRAQRCARDAEPRRGDRARQCRARSRRRHGVRRGHADARGGRRRARARARPVPAQRRARRQDADARSAPGRGDGLQAGDPAGLDAAGGDRRRRCSCWPRSRRRCKRRFRCKASRRPSAASVPTSGTACASASTLVRARSPPTRRPRPARPSARADGADPVRPRSGTRTSCATSATAGPCCTSTATCCTTCPVRRRLPRSRRAACRCTTRTLVFATPDHAVSSRPGRDGRPMPRAAGSGRRSASARAAAGIRLFDLGQPGQGIVHVMGPELGIVLPGADGDLRRQPYLHQRRPRRARVRRRLVGEHACAGDADPAPAAAASRCASAATARCARGVDGEGPGAAHHRPARRRGRDRLRDRIRRARRSRRMRGRGPPDAVQPVGRARRAHRPDRARRAHLRLRCAGRPLRAARAPPSNAAVARLAHAARPIPDAVFDREERFDAGRVAPTITWGTSPEHAIAIDGARSRSARRADPARRDTPGRPRSTTWGWRRPADRRDADRLGLHRLMRQLAPVGPARCGARSRAAARSPPA